MRRAPALVLAAALLAGCAGCSGRGPVAGPAPATTSGPPPTTATTTPTAPDPTDDPDDPAYDAGLSTPREDSYYPAHGDPGVDALHYDLDLSYDPDTRVLTGVAGIVLRATTTAARLQLDLRHFYRVSRVRVDGAPVDFRQTPADLLILTVPVVADRRYDVVVEYAGRPRRIWAPSQRADTPFLGLQRSADGSLWTMQEPYGAFTWYPVNDQPADKALYDFTLRTPDDWVGIANGELTSREIVGDQTVTTWHLDRPAASYLTTLAMGDYVETGVTTDDGLPISYWTKRGDTRSPARLQITPEVLAWNERHLGPYPFATLGLVVVDSDSAMETQTMITLGDGDYSLSPAVIEHELTHQWYGDLVTPTDWRDVWMNEGMAMFVQLAYQADRAGVSIDRKVDALRSTEAYLRGYAGPPGAYRPRLFGESNVYYGPALMWNALRHRLGDRAFWAMVRAWPAARAGGHATRADYYRWLDRRTGLDLRPFLQAWIMGRTTPRGSSIP